MTELLSTRNPLVVQARLLARERKQRLATGLAVLEGIRLAEEAIAANVDIAYVLHTEPLSERGDAVLQLLRTKGVPLYAVSAETLARTADTQSPQGIIGIYRPRLWSLDELPYGFVVLLDNLADPGNLGTVIRSQEAMGGAGVVVAGGVDPHNPKVVRGAMGSLFRLPVVQADVATALAALAGQGRPIYVADAGGDCQPWQVALGANAVLVIGNEAAGPSAEAHRLAHGVISIPMPGPTESLNAGVAASLLIYEAMRQRMQ
jgi:TrmH family RNA methyltransferase